MILGWVGLAFDSSEPGLTGANDGFGSIGNLEFGEDVGDVVADGFWG
jgi:hypothetical protein